MGKKPSADTDAETKAILQKAREERLVTQQKLLCANRPLCPFGEYKPSPSVVTPSKPLRVPSWDASMSLGRMLYEALLARAHCWHRYCDGGCSYQSSETLPPWQEMELCQQGLWEMTAWIFLFEPGSPARELYDAAEAYLAGNRVEARETDRDGRYTRFREAFEAMKARKDNE